MKHESSVLRVWVVATLLPLMAAAGCGGGDAAPQPEDGPAASFVLGQTDFTSTGTGAGATGMSNPTGVWTDGQRLARTTRERS